MRATRLEIRSAVFGGALVLAVLVTVVPASRAVAPPATVVLQGADVKLAAGAMIPLLAVNSFGHAVSVQRAVTVERWLANRWQPLSTPASGLLLRQDCRPDPRTRVINTRALVEGCITLAPRSTFRSQPWMGTMGDAQCICERCVQVPPGTYRYRGRLCGKPDAIYSAPFRLRRP